MTEQSIFTISAYETSAADFFGQLQKHSADLVLDVRLKNTGQLCGFTKLKDLQYLVPALTGAAYVHDPLFAPSPELLERYLSHEYSWEDYRREYRRLIRRRGALSVFREQYGNYHSVAVLGTATRRRQSHSEALMELLQEQQKENRNGISEEY